jgi:hypothetical protein
MTMVDGEEHLGGMTGEGIEVGEDWGAIIGCEGNQLATIMAWYWLQLWHDIMDVIDDIWLTSGFFG